MEVTKLILPTQFQINDDVVVNVCDCGQEDCEGVDISGKVVAVRITKAKVFYDVLDDYSAKVFENIDSNLVLCQ